MMGVADLIRAPAVADWIRVVPEIATRIALGAHLIHGGAEPGIMFEGQFIAVESQALALAIEVAKDLKVSSKVVSASSILEVRFRAEEAFCENIMSKKPLATVLFAVCPSEHYAFYRAKLPAHYMRQRGRVYSHWTETLDLGKALRFGILWLQWENSPAVHGLAIDAKKHGVKIVYDLDDDFQTAPDWHPMKRHLTSERIDLYWRMIEMADCVVVPTQTLADRFAHRAQRIEILPYCVPAKVLPKRRMKEDGVKRILWIGSPSHDGDLKIAAPAILQILREDPKVRFLCSFDTEPPNLLREVAGQLEKIPFVAMEEYYDSIAKLGADVTISPLADHPFNQCKTALKYFELGGMGYPYLVSPVAEYPELSNEGAPMMLVYDDEWYQAFRMALYETQWSTDLGERARQWVMQNRDIEERAVEWERLALSLQEA